MKFLFFISSVFIIIFLFSCSGDDNKPSHKEIAEYQRKLVSIHRNLVKNDADSIRRFIKDSSMRLIETKTGLWYNILDTTDGIAVNGGDHVTINYTLSLLNGTVCYSSDSLGSKTFTVGRGGVEAGLEEGILRMKEGERAVFILPPHLAYGVVGDGNRIPRLAILKYNVELLRVVRPKKPDEPVFK